MRHAGLRRPTSIFSALCVGSVGLIGSVHGEPVELSWRFLGNDTPAAGLCSAELTIGIPEFPPAHDGEASLYFNFGRKPADGLEAGPSYEHVNGDLFRIALPTKPQSRTVTRLTLVSQGAIRNLTDVPAGFFLVLKRADGSEVVQPAAANTDLSILRRQQHGAAGGPHRSAPGGKRATTIQALDPIAAVIPQPSRYQTLEGVFRLGGVPIACEPEQESSYRLLADALVAAGAPKPARLEANGPIRPAIVLKLGHVAIDGVTKTTGDEAYSLEVRPGSGVQVTGSDPAGLHYGVQTLIALLENSLATSDAGEGPALRAMAVLDAPHFRYRGLHLDVARNFQTPATVRKLLDLMAAYKLNRFHLHLTDDEGWRLEIRDLPELTSVGGRRGYSAGLREYLPPSFGSGPAATAAPGSGWYTRDEFVELLRYAAERHIEVVPEIDLPGHARAAICSMQVRYERLLAQGDAAAAQQFLLRRPDEAAVYESVQMWNDNVVDVRLESTIAFVDHVVSDVASMYEEAGLNLKNLHLGGDEVPSGCWGEGAPADVHALFGAFMDRCAEIVRSHGTRTAGWEEVFVADEGDDGLREGKASAGVCYAWNNIRGWGQEDAAYRVANAGTEVVLCGATHLYFDLAYDDAVDEPGYYWAGATETEEVFCFRPYTFFEGSVLDRAGSPASDLDKGRMTVLTEEGRRRVIGMQCHLWGENLNSSGRLEYLAFPRVLAFAERAWVGPADARFRSGDPARSWEQFANHVGRRELPRLDRSFGGVRYRIPSTRIIERGETIEAETDFPGMTVRYTTDGSEPEPASPAAYGKLPSHGTFRFRAFNTRNRGGLTTDWRPSSESVPRD